mgnify:CR=1 FL=1
MNRELIYLMHILVFAPLFIYLGHHNTWNNKYLSNILMGLGLVIILYHSYLLAVKYQNIEYISLVNLFHILVIGPILLFIGYKNQIDYPLNQIFLILGYGSLVNFLLMLLKNYI